MLTFSSGEQGLSTMNTCQRLSFTLISGHNDVKQPLTEQKEGNLGHQNYIKF
jgi:hypothetical protein